MNLVFRRYFDKSNSDGQGTSIIACCNPQLIFFNTCDLGFSHMIEKLERVNKARIGNKSKFSHLAMHPKQSMLRSRIKKKKKQNKKKKRGSTSANSD